MFKPCTFAWQVKSSEHLEGRNRNIHPSPKLGTPHFFLINKFGTMVTKFKNLCFYGCPMFKEMSQVNMAFNEENFGGDFDQLLRQPSLSSAWILIIGLYDIQFGLKYSSLTFYTTFINLIIPTSIIILFNILLLLLDINIMISQGIDELVLIKLWKENATTEVGWWGYNGAIWDVRGREVSVLYSE